MEPEIIAVTIIKGSDKTIERVIQDMTARGWRHTGFANNETANAGVSAPEVAPTFSREGKGE